MLAADLTSRGEGAGLLERICGLGKERPEHLEVMGGDRVQLEPGVDTLAPGTLGEPLRILDHHVADATLDEHGGQPREIAEQGADQGVVDGMPVEVGGDEAVELLQRERRLGLARQLADVLEGEVDTGAQQRGAPGQGELLGLEAEHERHGQPAAGRIAGEGDLFGVGAAVEHPQVGARRVLERRRERVLGREPVLGNHGARVRGDGQRPGEVPVPERRSHDVAAAMQEQQRWLRPCVRREQQGRHAAGVDGPHVDLRRRRELGVQ